MTNKVNTSPEKEKRKSKLIVRLMLPMMLLVLLQLAAFFSILLVGGEFKYIEQYAYNTLVEKTENRKTYIENELQQRMPFVHEAAEKVNRMIAGILEDEGAFISDLQFNRDLNNRIMESSLDSLVDLLRRSTVNDVYLILDTGDLYAEDGGSDNAKAALYLRDLDAMTDAGYEDLLMEMGPSSISRQYGIILDSGWSLHFSPDSNAAEDYDFYDKTIQIARDNRGLSQEQLGYWSGFSRLSRNVAASMKYTVPLIAQDGTVYGVIGIGLTENSILANIPANDFMSETACYVLGHSRTEDSYEIVTYSGASYTRLIGDMTELPISGMLTENVYDFDLSSGTRLAGSVQNIPLYSLTSPYRGEKWALISVAERASVLSPLTNLIRMLIIAAVFSVAVSLLVVILSSSNVVKPIASAIKTMNSKREYGQVIHFAPSNIEEIDRMTDAITQLQINVQDFSSQVSQMIRIANVGLGTFMYDRTDDTVFVGQSLLRLLRLQMDHAEDVMMSREAFLENIIADETREVVTESLAIVPDEARSDYSREYSIALADGTTVWMRLSLVHNTNKSIGILQDITSAMMEKKRIEYERDYDGTTGLLNRRAYYHCLNDLFHDKSALRTTAIIMLDLDNLKYVNDTYGHDFGDDYIKTAAAALKKFQNYGGIVSRLSGDEFNICLPGFGSKNEIREIITQVRGQLLKSACVLADGTRFKIRASMGVAWYPDDAQTYELLMKYADFAMYTIKHSKKGGLAEFNMSTYTTDSVLLTGVEEMNRIIDERSVRYAFQSIVSAKTGEVCGYEALMRPQSSIFQTQLELLRTAKTGAKLYEIERLTWMKALDDFQAQIDAGHIASDSYIFINSISNCVLEPEDVQNIEAAHAKLLAQVVLEIVGGENSNEEYAVRKMNRMRQWNAQVALDDFGVSYNSEQILSAVQPNIVKIDRSIISGCDKDVSRRAIISSLVKLAQTKRILVLAGGVETEDELRAVISCGVDLLQGYYINRPLFEPEPPAKEVTDLMRKLSAAYDAQPDEII